MSVDPQFEKRIDPEVSKYFSNLAKKRKHPYLPFKNKGYAKLMSEKAVKAKREKQQTLEGENSAESEGSTKAKP